MRILVLVALLVTSTCWAQEPASNPQQPPSQAQALPPAASQKQTIVIPAGTRIPAQLASPVTTKLGRPGDSVRAVTTFPVTVDTELAIPAGSYIEGVIDKVNRRGGPSGPVLQMHFTRILFANGYNVPVNGDNTQAKIVTPTVGSPNTSALEAVTPTLMAVWSSGLVSANEPIFGESSFTMTANQFPTQPSLPTLPPLPKSHMGTIIGVSVGVAAAALVGILVAAKHNGGTSNVLFDTGWQFELVLRSPLSVDATSVAAAVDGSSAP